MVLRRGSVINCSVFLARTGHLPSSSRVPSLSADEVAGVAPGHRVLAALAHSKDGRAAAIRPPGVEVAIVGALSVGGVLALLNESCSVGIVALVKEVKRRSHDGGGCYGGEKDGLEGHHCAGVRSLLDDLMMMLKKRALSSVYISRVRSQSKVKFQE